MISHLENGIIPLTGHQNILRFKISVDYSVLVTILDASYELEEVVLGSQFLHEYSFAFLFVQSVLQVTTIHKLKN